MTVGTVLVVTSVDGTFCSLLWQRNNTWIILVENVVVIMKSNMKKITITEFEEIISKKEDLKERAKGITGKGDDLRHKIVSFAESLGYELDFEMDPEELDDASLDDVVGGKSDIFDSCDHNYVFYKTEPGRFFGTNEVYKCTKCGNAMYNRILG